MYVQTSVEFYYQRFFLVFVIEINSFKHRHFLKKNPHRYRLCKYDHFSKHRLCKLDVLKFS